MPTRASDHWGYALRSHHGPWCAWCLRTISVGKGEMHHMMPTARVRNLLHWSLCLPWTVPAHFSCHRNELHCMSDELGSYLQRTLALSASDKTRLSARLHDLGYYWLPFLLNGHQLTSGGTSNTDLLTGFLKSAAGIQQGKRLRTCLLGSITLPPRIDTLVAASNLDFASGSHKQSQLLLKRAGSLLCKERRAAREEWVAAFLRRKAQLELDIPTAEEALTLSCASRYTSSTAVLQLGWIQYTQDDSRKALRRFEELQERTDLTWLYRAECLLGHAVCAINLGKVDEEVYSWLIGAQYLYGMLGIIGPSLRFLWYVSPQTKSATDLLLSQPAFSSYSDAKCFEIRRMAIKGDRTGLLCSVLGHHDLRYALFDSLQATRSDMQKP